MPTSTSPSASPQIREEVAFQKATVARLKREIRGIDRNSRKRYIREFHEDFSDYEAVSSLDDLSIACYKSDVVYIGDYHALPASQEFAAWLLGDIASRSREVVLCMEMVFGRHQRALDRFMGGEMAEAEFLKAIRYDLEWGYDWGAFRRLFDTARRHGMTVLGIDSGPRTGVRYIRKRDAYAAARITDLADSRPNAKIVVLIGESHLARKHLPRRVTDSLKKRGIEKRGLTVLQNLEDVYWRLAEQGLEQVDVVDMSPGVYCHFNASPIAKYEAYRHILEIWKGDAIDDGQVDLTSTVHNVIDTILRFLRIDKYNYCVGRAQRCREYMIDVYPEVISSLDEDDLRETLRAGGFSAGESAEVVAHVARNGSCFVPRINAIIIGRFNMVHAGEEAAHFVNIVLKHELYDAAPRRMPQHDLFYSGVIEEALGFFGSKLIDPSRNHFFETEFYRFYRKDRETIEANTPYSYDEFNAIIDFILLHKKFEQTYEGYSEIPAAILDGIRAEPRRANIMVHELGYFLGQQIYDAYRAGILDRKRITALFRMSFRQSGSALSTYLDLTREVASSQTEDERRS
jgi:hypothetical protein